MYGITFNGDMEQGQNGCLYLSMGAAHMLISGMGQTRLFHSLYRHITKCVAQCINVYWYRLVIYVIRVPGKGGTMGLKHSLKSGHAELTEISFQHGACSFCVISYNCTTYCCLQFCFTTVHKNVKGSFVA